MQALAAPGIHRAGRWNEPSGYDRIRSRSYIN